MLGGAKVQANYIEIPLEQRREHLYGASIERDLLSSAQFFLIARSDQMDEQQIIAEVPKQLRIASPETIDAVLRSYTRALNIEHTHRVPSALPVDNRASYFELQKRGPFWEAITQTEGLAVFIPKELESLNLKLVAVK
jgi:type VI secretion system protein ImpJ